MGSRRCTQLTRQRRGFGVGTTARSAGTATGEINTKPDHGSKARSGAEADSEQLLAQVGVVSPGTVADYQRQVLIVLAGLLPARWDASAGAPTAPSERRTSSIRTPK